MQKSIPEISTVSDEPIDNATLFDFDKKSDELVEFLTSENTGTPYVIALDGSWGSGKSTFILTTKRKLEESKKKKSFKTEIVYFDAWKYESSDPASSLVYNMMKIIEKPKSGLATSIANCAIDCLARRTINMSLDDIKKHFTNSMRAVENLEEEIKKALNEHLPNGRLIVLIDDLDRCTLENTLNILNSLKLFLSLEKCIFVLAVDMPKIELAWKSRYGNDEELLKEGANYLDKIFQHKISVPPKNYEDLKKFIQSLNKELEFEVVDLIARVGPKNLRGIKKLMNTAGFISKAAKNNVLKYELAIIWVLFTHLIGSNEKAVKFYGFIYNETGNEFIKYLGDVLPLANLKEYQQHVTQNPAFTKIGGIPSKNDDLMREFFGHARTLINDFRRQYADGQMMDTLNEIVHSTHETSE